MDLHLIYDSLIAVLVPTVLGIIAWAFSLGNRVSVLEEAKDGLKVLIASKFDDMQRQLEAIKDLIKILSGK